MALHARTGMEGFYVAVRGGIEDLVEPKIFFTEKSQKFVQDVLGIEPQHLGLKLEAFVISKLGMSFPQHCFVLTFPKMNVLLSTVSDHLINSSVIVASLYRMS
jgi:hypothetical protein